MTDQADFLDQLSRQVANLDRRLASYERAAMQARIGPAFPGRVGALEGGPESGVGVGPYEEAALIAANVITAREIVTGSLTVGLLASGGLALNDNPKFDANVPDTAAGDPITGWGLAGATSQSQTGIPGTVPPYGNYAYINDGGTAQGGIRSLPLTPVNQGSAYRLSGYVWAHSGAPKVDFWLHRYNGSKTLIGAVAVLLNNATPSGSAAAPTFYVTTYKPVAGDAFLSIVLDNHGSTTAGTDVFSAGQIELVEVPANVENVGATVRINSTGLTVTNGAISVTNAGATVIIDGTSNMFKIIATGEFTVPGVDGSGSGGGVSEETVVLGLGINYIPAYLGFTEVFISPDNAGRTLPRVVFDNSNGFADSGLVIDVIHMHVVDDASSSDTFVVGTLETRLDRSAGDVVVAYYVLKEVAF